MRTASELMSLVHEFGRIELEIGKGKASDRELVRSDQIRDALLADLTGYEKVVEFVERVMTEHWDMAVCRCALCVKGRDLGLRPREGYPTDPRPKITEEKAGYEWEAKS